ncbi:MAG: AAA family ATPase [Oscillospiraceae bacterium]|jgi:Cdc6-like AAA superfamily ATPase|nr:AAA family ATPase [Oscillospiraceae bacterium]
MGLFTKIEELDLSVRSYNCLMRAGMKTLGDIVRAAREGTLVNVRNLGKKSFEEIMAVLRSRNIQVDGDIDADDEELEREVEAIMEGLYSTSPKEELLLSYDRIRGRVAALVDAELKRDAALVREREFLAEYFAGGRAAVAFSYLVDSPFKSVSTRVAEMLSKGYVEATDGFAESLRIKSVTQLTSTDENGKRRSFDARTLGCDFCEALCLTDVEMLAALPQEDFAEMLEYFELNCNKSYIFVGDLSFGSQQMNARVEMLRSVLPMRVVDLGRVRVDGEAIVRRTLEEFSPGADADAAAALWRKTATENPDMTVEESVTRTVGQAIFSGGGVAAAAAEPPRERMRAMAELERLTGLRSVKETVRDIAAHSEASRLKAEAGAPREVFVPNALFLGNPGTGKTTVAGIVARLYHELGLLRRGHLVTANRASLVAEYLGQTAIKTRGVFMSALDGVLFVDEAYSLYTEESRGDSYGREALTTLTQLMSDFAGRCCVIFAGYEKDIAYMLSGANPGLRDRFPFRLMFDDYNAEELTEIFTKKLASGGVTARGESEGIVLEFFARCFGARDEFFSNGRLAENVAQEVVLQQERRLLARRDRTGEKITRDELFTVEERDCRAACEALQKRYAEKPRETGAIGFGV